MEHRSRHPSALTACEGCRKLKMRCVRSSQDTNEACDRCKHNSRPCHMPPPRQMGRRPGALGRYRGLEKAYRKVQSEIQKINKNDNNSEKITLPEVHTSPRMEECLDFPTEPTPNHQTTSPALNLETGSVEDTKLCPQPQIHKPVALMADASGAVQTPSSNSASSGVSPTFRGLSDGDPGNSGLARRFLRNPGYVALGLEKLSRKSLEQGLETLLAPEEQIPCKYPDYFTSPESGLHRDTGPDVDPLELGLVSMEEVSYLFHIYFTRIHPFIGILDPVLHTVDFVQSRSALLLTWMLVVAAQFDYNFDALAKRLRMHGERLSKYVYKRGYKSVEIIQGYYISFLARSPAQSLSEERAWLYTSYASALAAELGLDQKSLACAPLKSTTEQPSKDQELRQRLARNRERAWLRIFLWERAQSAMLGRMNGFPETDLTLSIDTWGLHPLADPVDKYTVAFIHLRRKLAAVQNELRMETSLPNSDPHWARRKIDNSLHTWCQSWVHYPSTIGAPYENIVGIFLRHVYMHGRLWALSFTLHVSSCSEHTTEANLAGLKEDCFVAAIRCCEDAVHDLESVGEPLDGMLAPTWAMLSYAVILALTLFRQKTTWNQRDFVSTRWHG